MRQAPQWSSNRGDTALRDDLMEIDEILNDVTSLRASSWQAPGVETNLQIDDTRLLASDVQIFIVLDSNVLISFLALVRELLASISRQTVKMALCLPNVVVAELNFLKERNPNPNTRALAQAANVWLLATVRNRNGLLRGQQKHEGLEQLETDRSHNIRRVNDDQIIDYCQYLLNAHRQGQGAVCLLSNDQNCCLKAELSGIITISPKAGTTAESIISTILRKMQNIGTHTPVSPTHIPYTTGTTNGLSHGSSSTQYSVATRSERSADGLMDLDDDENLISTSVSHPLSHLHSQLIDHLSQILPHLAYDAALQEEARRKEDKNSPQPKAKPSALYTSIHAPKGGATDASHHAFIMPTQEEVQSWKPLDCIHFALEFPPSGDTNPTARKRSQRPPSITRLKLFLLVYGQPGARRGKDWSVGDWKSSLEELEQVATFCNWESVQQCVIICRSQLSTSGLQV
ncbi:hypothetical protein M408DRAFT_331128 [Serendipita vermifera MAFF 305830]|uniref:PIN domain-containing protein n=1 Tax=Serendipita vermifera MAFF 305830 TaxID=933852 RepID=A0A0C2WGT8_SERVB|nr:hypothetical protein M408DRAFT_331128 [Serendipita vermifera MAFF 305830]